MSNIFYTILLFLFSISAMNAEIKLIQIKVQDAVDPQSLYTPSKMYDELSYDDQTSYLLPVKNKRIEGYRMPFIKNFGHDVLLVGPFLDVCGDIQILDAENRLKATIKPTSFVSKGKKDFWFPNERRKKNEGYVHFRINKGSMDRISTQNFKIKVGNIENLDVVDCLVADRFEIDAVLFTGKEVPEREVGTVDNISTIKNTFETGNAYEIKIKINGGLLSRYTYKLFESELFYHHAEESVFGSTCIGNLNLSGSITKVKLIENNDAVAMKLISSTSSELERRAFFGYMIGLIDGKIGNLTKINIDKNAATLPFGTTLNRQQEPNSWGPYIFARFSNDVYKFGQYTDLGIFEVGDCKKKGIVNGSGGPTRPIFIKQQTDIERGIK